MVDHNDKRSETEEMNKKNPTTSEESQSQANDIIKRCADCGTSKTPLWRGGPAGPKSLCNACGIRSRKKRRAILGLKTSDEKKSKKNSHSNNHHHRSNSTSTTSSSSSTTTTTNNTKLGSPLHQRLIALGREVMMQRSTADNKQHRRRKLGEEEQAAVLLMALSYGSVYA